MIGQALSQVVSITLAQLEISTGSYVMSAIGNGLML